MIDVVIPLHKKDLPCFRLCVDAIRQHVNCERIIVLCNNEIRDEAERTGALFFDEDAIVSGLGSRSYPSDLWGWYFQQILKLAAANLVATDYYLVVDSDTIFLNDIDFFNENGKPLYAIGTEYLQWYFDTFEKLLGFKAEREYSFTCHHMIYKRDIVLEMLERFSNLSPWYRNITYFVEKQLDSPAFVGKLKFNEQETYGHYIKKFHPQGAQLETTEMVQHWFSSELQAYQVAFEKI